jgi:DNA helicase-2/ATP-dependent DNA helicase PcrA
MPISEEVIAMLNEEEESVRKVISSLKEQLLAARKRLGVEADNVQDYEEQIRSSRLEEDKQQLIADQAVSKKLSEMKKDELESLEKLLERPYIARIALEEEQPNGKIQRIEYKIGLQPNIDCRIIDWKKAPLSRLYYEFKEGEEYSEIIQGRERNGRVVLRNKVDIVGGQLRKVSCRYGEFVREDGEWKEARAATVRRAQDYGSLPDVLSLITAEQFKAITEDANSTVLIQGVAGSGKTTVALYRLAWLLQREGTELKAEDTVIIVRSGVLKSYIARSLPQLGLGGVEVLTYTEWAGRTLQAVYPESENHSRMPYQLPEGSHPLGVERVKRSMALLSTLEEFTLREKQRVVEDLEQNLPLDKFSPASRKALEKLKGQLSNAERIPNPSLMQVIGNFSAEIEADSELGKLIAADGRPLAEHLSHVKESCVRYWQDACQLLGLTEEILQRDESRLLDRGLIRAAADTMRQSGEALCFDAAEDALLLRLYQLKNSSVCIRDKQFGLYKHIVVDEVQDFSPVELATVVGAVEKLSQLTVVGDSAQELSEESTFPGWEKLRAYWKLGDTLSQFMKLTVSHRSSLQIMQFADFILGERRTSDGRKGVAPLWFKTLSENSGVSEAISWLSRVLEKYPDSIVAVICRNQREASFVQSLLEPTFGSAVRLGSDSGFSFEEGIIVCAVEQVKGLEFPHVLIWNPSASAYPNNAQSKNLLYVAATRAEEHLALVTWGKESPLLPNPYSKLVRLKEEELPEGDEENPLLAGMLRSERSGD